MLIAIIGISLYNTQSQKALKAWYDRGESHIQMFNVGDLIIHPERYVNDCHAGTSIIVEVFVAEKDRLYGFAPRTLRLKKQKTGEIYVKSEYSIYLGVERGFLTHVPSR